MGVRFALKETRKQLIGLVLKRWKSFAEIVQMLGASRLWNPAALYHAAFNRNVP